MPDRMTPTASSHASRNPAHVGEHGQPNLLEYGVDRVQVDDVDRQPVRYRAEQHADEHVQLEHPAWRIAEDLVIELDPEDDGGQQAHLEAHLRSEDEVRLGHRGGAGLHEHREPAHGPGGHRVQQVLLPLGKEHEQQKVQQPQRERHADEESVAPNDVHDFPRVVDRRLLPAERDGAGLVAAGDDPDELVRHLHAHRNDDLLAMQADRDRRLGEGGHRTLSVAESAGALSVYEQVDHPRLNHPQHHRATEQIRGHAQAQAVPGDPRPVFGEAIGQRRIEQAPIRVIEGRRGPRCIVAGGGQSRPGTSVGQSRPGTSLVSPRAAEFDENAGLDGLGPNGHSAIGDRPLRGRRRPSGDKEGQRGAHEQKYSTKRVAMRHAQRT